MKPPLGASHGPQDNAGSQAHSPLYVFMGLAFPPLLRQTQAIKQNNLWPSLVLTLGLLKCHCSKKCRNPMNGSMFIFMKTWTDFFILDNIGIFCPENMAVLLQVAAQDGSCSTCMDFFKYLFCCLTSDISLAWVVSSSFFFFEFLMQHWSGW